MDHGLLLALLYPLQDALRFGAAIASGLGQVLTVLILLTHFLRKRSELRFRRFAVSGLIINIVLSALIYGALFFGTEAIWIAPFVTELLTLAAAIVLGRNSRRVYR